MKQNPKKNVLVIRHVFEKFLCEGDLDGYNQFVAEDAVAHCPESWQKLHSTEICGRENIEKIDREYMQAFHCRGVNIEDLMAFDDKVFVRWATTGIHRGDFYGVQATNRQFSVSGQSLYRFNPKGRVAEFWQSWDMLGLLNQIGWGPADAAPTVSKDVEKMLKKAHRLSARERDCLRLLVRGKTAKDTAAQLFVSPRTVEYYFENIKDKLDCLNKRELFSFARLMERHNLL